MKVKIKKLDNRAVIPSYSKHGDAGLDLTAVSVTTMKPEYIEYTTELAIEIPEGYVGLIYPRSSVSKTELTLANSVGVIDSNYRGPIKLRFRHNGQQKVYKSGDRIGQLIIIPYPQVEFEEVEELTETERGQGSFGSTGK